MPALLDLFCGAGGAAAGYRRAGFSVVGVDINPQPRYAGDEFIQFDAIEFLTRLIAGKTACGWRLEDFAGIHASPPCQKFSAYRRRGAGVGDSYPDLIAPVRELLRAAGLPYVIENIPSSPVVATVKLCGSSFGLDVQRHRWFEMSFWMMSPPCQHGVWAPRFPSATNRTNLRCTVEIGVWRIPLPVQQAAMGIDWMTLRELTEAIPPAYTEYIGDYLLGHLRELAA